ncbi:MAG: UDP-N-acetylmuramoyl-L-alanyl-D-glutamate--2,6-diaminopimelate ligase [Candidatus Limnocylindrales bacterium]
MTGSLGEAGRASGEVAPSETMRSLLSAAEPARPRPLGELIERLGSSGRLRAVQAAGRRGAAEPGAGMLPVRGVTSDSRQVRPGFVFVAVSGTHADGHDFVAASAALGAAVAIVERPVAGAALSQIVVADTRRALATAAAWWYGDPSRELGMVGITGTDGKTTTAFLAVAVLEAAGISTGLITTAAVKVGSLRTANPEHVTTPEAPQLQRMLRAMVAVGNEAAVVETTSHGLALNRVAEIAYDVAIFTNLTHEHLELHGSFEAYRDAKLSLFRRLGLDAPAKRTARPWPRVAIVNADDPAAQLFVEAAREAGASVLTYGETATADVRALDVAEGARSMRINVATPGWRGGVELRLAGRFNVHNALAAIALGEALGLDGGTVRAALASVEGVPGRMERVDCGQPFGVVVDYAHSPASLEKVLGVLAPIAAAGGGGLIAVFGSAGERDVRKRPMMGRIAAERCRVVVVANEDPRGEDAMAIIDEIAAGAEGSDGPPDREILRIADRRKAIEAAFERARPGDVVLLAGKGHEQTIIMADGPMPWDERSEAVRALERLGYRSEAGGMHNVGGR